MAFCGALALQAVLAGRKVRDPGDNRTNLYLLGLAHSAAGKDRPRKVNTEILHAIGLSSQVGGRFASGEGVQDALFIEPCMLFQTDEIDGMLQSINKARDARHESIMGTLLTMYSSANSVFPMRRKAGKDAPGAIDQPCLVVFGTAIPNHYYEALSERMLTNGFFARMIILECGKRSSGPGAEHPAAAGARAGDRQVVGGLPARHGEPAELASRPADRPADRRGQEDPDRDPPRGRGGVRQGGRRKRRGRHDRVGSRERARPQARPALRREREPRTTGDRQGGRRVGQAVRHPPDEADALHGAGLRRGQPLPRRVPEVPAEAARGPGEELSHSVLLKRMKIGCQELPRSRGHARAAAETS